MDGRLVMAKIGSNTNELAGGARNLLHSYCTAHWSSGFSELNPPQRRPLAASSRRVTGLPCLLSTRACCAPLHCRPPDAFVLAHAHPLARPASKSSAVGETPSSVDLSCRLSRWETFPLLLSLDQLRALPHSLWQPSFQSLISASVCSACLVYRLPYLAFASISLVEHNNPPKARDEQEASTKKKLPRKKKKKRSCYGSRVSSIHQRFSRPSLTSLHQAELLASSFLYLNSCPFFLFVALHVIGPTIHLYLGDSLQRNILPVGIVIA